MKNRTKTWDLKKILKDQIKSSPLVGQVNFNSICQDHRKVSEGNIFIAIKGTSFDGHSVISEVIQKNPACIIVEKIPPKISKEYKNILVVKNSRVALDRLAYLFYGEPSKKMFVVAVTGTSGKTTTSHMVEHILNGLKISTAVVGTNDHHFKNKIWEAKTTTPGSIELYSRLQELARLKAKGLSIEASSHALDQFRINCLELDVAIFTNLSRDHLDYHKSLHHYFLSKNKLFSDLLKKSTKKKKFAVLNNDDKYSKKIKTSSGIKKISYGTKNSDLTYKIIEQNFSFVKFEVIYQKNSEVVKLLVPGQYNILNALAAIGAGLATDASLKKVAATLSNYKGVRGRLEAVPNSQGLHVFVDYAHKPDALQNVLDCLNKVRDGLNPKPKIITVFGCGGDRDPGKRPMMAKIAAKMSDQIIVTSDNPRSEDADKIIQEICSGFNQIDLTKVYTQADRKLAMKKAIELANAGDVILVAGKGHETYQIIGNETFDFDDVAVMKDLL